MCVCVCVCVCVCTCMYYTPGIIRFVTLPLEILEKTSFHPWKFCKIV